jgi:hypothetical protein
MKLYIFVTSLITLLVAWFTSMNIYLTGALLLVAYSWWPYYLLNYSGSARIRYEFPVYLESELRSFFRDLVFHLPGTMPLKINFVQSAMAKRLLHSPPPLEVSDDDDEVMPPPNPMILNGRTHIWNYEIAKREGKLDALVDDMFESHLAFWSRTIFFAVAMAAFGAAIVYTL